jgi:hypothetical protein
MATEIDQFKLHALFANPSEFYELMVNRKGYIPKQVVEFDAEIVAPEWSSMGCVLLCLMVHHERKAYVVMLDSEALSSMRESLEQLQVGLNMAQLITRPRFCFGQGL